MQELREAIINPQQPYPARAVWRYGISPYTLAKLEKLARAKFEIGRFNKAALRNIAETVNASSEIEGEDVAADKLDLALAAATRPSARRIDEELEQRMVAVASIIRTLLWTLVEPPREFISFEFVLEIHRRMFESTNPDVAGRLKTKRVAIEGGSYSVKTLPPEKSELFLRELCERTSRSLTTADTSRFLTTAEFILDFLAIHPFHDGNGRTARLLSTYLLERCGYHFARFYPLDNVILENRDAYYEALFRAQQRWYREDEDLTPWIEFYTDMVFNQYVRAFQRVNARILE